MLRAFAIVAITLTLAGCSGGSSSGLCILTFPICETSSGPSWNAMENQALVDAFNLAGKGPGQPGFTEAESYIYRSPQDWRMYSKYRNQVYVSHELTLPKVGRVLGVAITSPKGQLGIDGEKFLVIDGPSMAKDPWRGAATLFHEALHLEYPDMPHNQVYLEEAAAVVRMGGPNYLVAEAAVGAASYSRNSLSRAGVVACAYKPHPPAKAI